MKNIYIKNLSISFFLFLIMGCENLLQNNDEVAIDSEELEFFSRSIEEDISLSKNSKNKLRRGINEFGEKNKHDKDRKPGFLWYLASEMQSTLNDEEKAEIFANIENKNHKINKPRQKHNEFERDEKNNNGHNQGEKDLFEIPKKVKEDIKITSVSTADQVLKIALTKELKKTEWVEVENLSKTGKDDKSSASIQ